MFMGNLSAHGGAGGCLLRLQARGEPGRPDAGWLVREVSR